MTKEGDKLSFISLAVALASDYLSVYVINAKDDSYVEYKTDGADEELIPISEGDDFYKDVTKKCPEQVWPEDQEYFLNRFKKEAVINALNEGKSFTLNYRLNINGEPRYFFLKTIRAGEEYILVAVRDVDEEKRRELKATAEAATYSQISGALASRYEVLYFINIEDNSFIQYSSSKEYSELGVTVKGENFFEESDKDIRQFIHPDDVDYLLKHIQKDFLIKELNELGTVILAYRQLWGSEYQYMNMIVLRPKNDDKHIVMGVVNNNAQHMREELLKKESRTFSDISMALAENYEVIFRINTKEYDYLAFSSDDKYSKFQAKLGLDGTNFFKETEKIFDVVVHKDDLEMMKTALNKENFLSSIQKFGKLFLTYRMVVGDKFYYTSLFAVQSKENPDYIVMAIANVDEAKRMELAYVNAMDMANRDAMTGVKNKRAYVQAEIELDEQIEKKVHLAFAVVLCDLNGLKQVNDIQGHQAGDEYIKSSCSIICNVFSHSPVFRIGGDEFAVILKDRDYDNRYELVEKLGLEQESKRVNGIKPIAVGMSEFDPKTDMRVQDIFERADSLMYEDKKGCKSEINRVG
ncbi:GGDEF domain-containing protein [Eubacterium sp.]|uniref:GGDEF domain-containing protein n=1 Tax=Eubacterium sp. TaxID=142586 RepID=UPI0025E55300|nr:GGDEF domain-containing protein [Eubacterium sp.]MCR5628742.1 GGDEF domain-containing protein [Eubacterium sp.]